MKMIRNYLTSTEIAFISSEVIAKPTAWERTVVKNALIAQVLIEDLGEFDDCNEIYDYLVDNGINLNTTVRNICDLDFIIKEELGVTKAVKDFLTDLNNKIDTYAQQLDNVNREELIDKMKELIDTKQLKEVE